MSGRLPMNAVQQLIARYSTTGTFRSCPSGTQACARKYLATLALSYRVRIRLRMLQIVDIDGFTRI